MKKIIFCFIIALGTVGAVNAQNQPSNARPVDTNKKMEDVVYLKNGAIIRGVIIEQVPDKTL
jgi:hypothetical protein